MQGAGAGATDQPAPGHPSDGGPGRWIVTVGVLLVVGLIGVLAFLAGRSDPGDAVRRAGERFPATTLPPPTTRSTPTSTTTAASTTATTTSATTVAGTTTTATVSATIGELVPAVAALAEPLAAPADAQARIVELLTTGRHDVAAVDDVLSICAAVGLDAPLRAGGRWERDGRRIASSAPAARTPPGFGDCLSDGGAALPDGSYQFIAVDSDGNESAVGGLVVGARQIEQRFENNAGAALCALRIAPTTSAYFEVYVYDGAPIAPGGRVTLPVADVAQDVEAVGCDTGEVVAGFDFTPSAEDVQPLGP